MKKVILGLFVALTFTTVAEGSGTSIFAFTEGSDNFTTPDFYGVEYKSGPAGVFIESIEYNVQADSDAFFDFNGSGTFEDLQEPGLGTLLGLTAADISYEFLAPVGGNPLHVGRLRFNFTPGTFGVGDFLGFGADTDFLGSDPCSGGNFGLAPVLFSVLLSSGEGSAAPFVFVNTLRSEVDLEIVGPVAVESVSFGKIKALYH